MQPVTVPLPREDTMSHQQAQANLEIVFDWMNAMRYRDIETIARLFDPAVVWVDVAGEVACDGREHALAWLRAAPTGPREVDAVELVANDEHVMLGVRNHARDELAGVKLEDGQSFTVFTLSGGKIVRLRGHIHRDDALAEAGLADYSWR
jgi:limonene-1,2-epoxide hydrolase